MRQRGLRTLHATLRISEGPARRRTQTDIPEYALTAKPSGEQITKTARVATRILTAVADEGQHVRSKVAGPVH